MEEKSRLTIDLPVELHRKLKSVSALHGLNMKQLMIMAINKEIEKLETKKKSDD